MKLNSNQKLEANVYELEIAVEEPEFREGFEKAYKKNYKRIKVPGFRNGKAPRGIILAHVGGEGFFYEDAVEETWGDAYEAAVKEAGIDPVDRPQVEMIDLDAKGYSFKAKVTVKPEVKLEGYKGLSVVKPDSAVTDAEVDEELKNRADRNSRLVEVTDRPAEMGDHTTINFEGSVDGVPFEGGKGEDFPLVLGSNQFIGGFEEQIAGHSIGEEFDVNVTFPENYHAEALRAKPAVFKVKLLSLKFKEIPEIDDEFAKDISEFDTLAELREDIRAKAAETKAQKAEDAYENELVEAAAAKMEAEIPQVMVDHKIDELVQEFSYRLQSQGLNIETYFQYTGSSMEEFRKSYADQALLQVRCGLALEKIAELEGLAASDEEIEAEYQRTAESYKTDIERIKKAIPARDIADKLKLNKAIDLLKAEAAPAPAAK